MKAADDLDKLQSNTSMVARCFRNFHNVVGEILLTLGKNLKEHYFQDALAKEVSRLKITRISCSSNLGKN